MKAVVIHSGGMDSSICLALAMREFGKENVLSLTFDYNQRHHTERAAAAKICRDWGVAHKVVSVDFFGQITDNALINKNTPIVHAQDNPPNTLVCSRNGLFAILGGVQAHYLGAQVIYLGVIGVEGSHSGYRDCSRTYMDRIQDLIRIDLDNPHFEVRTPIVAMTKKETLVVAHELGILPYLLRETITCYEGLQGQGCRSCPACQLRNAGIEQFVREYPAYAPFLPTTE